MHVVLFGATGNIGTAVAAELVARDHTVIGVTRSGGTGTGTPAPRDTADNADRADTPDAAVAAVAAVADLTMRTGDVTDPACVAEVARGADAVISAIGPPWDTDQPQPFVAAARGLVDGLRRVGVRRLLVVGGAGSLEVAPGVQAVDAPGFPDHYRPRALAQREALEFYLTVDDLDWTYVAPAAEIGAGPHTEDYQLGHHLVLFAEDGKSHISYADFADGMVDCLEQGTHLRERITLAD